MQVNCLADPLIGIGDSLGRIKFQMRLRCWGTQAIVNREVK